MNSDIEKFQKVCTTQGGEWDSDREGCKLRKDFFYLEEPETCEKNGDSFGVFDDTDFDACKENTIYEYCKEHILNSFDEYPTQDMEDKRKLEKNFDFENIKPPRLSEGLMQCFKKEVLPQRKITQSLDEFDRLNDTICEYELKILYVNLYTAQKFNKKNTKHAIDKNVFPAKLYKFQKFDNPLYRYAIKKKCDLKELYWNHAEKFDSKTIDKAIDKGEEFSVLASKALDNFSQDNISHYVSFIENNKEWNAYTKLIKFECISFKPMNKKNISKSILFLENFTRKKNLEYYKSDRERIADKLKWAFQNFYHTNAEKLSKKNIDKALDIGISLE